VPGQCVAKFSTASSAERLHEFVETHGYNNKSEGRYWELVGLHQANQAPSTETLNVRAGDATQLARKQREYVTLHGPGCRGAASPEKKKKRRLRKKRQRLARRNAGQSGMGSNLCPATESIA
jgi:4-hydroxyphenylpyruvate dioxygenase-like putative hemolysin